MKLVILDRDGVINKDSDTFIKSPDEWIPIPNSADAIAFFNQYDYLVAVATNQSGISRKLFTIHDLNQIHSKMLKHIKNAGGEIEGIWFCPHSEKDNCQCRKPKTGLVDDILQRLNIEAGETYMVGDSLRDLQCIHEAGGIPVLVLTGKGKKTLSESELPENTLVYDDLWTFAQDICLSKSDY
ncbi:D-glycero-beta-D-manno-heptose 1,7-bisphosphate 7-phosphatase [Neisseriaceae bacterium PsAf]|nr:D-glycero-beta-D-manno-heptose 1,7-bisphosphate 7-phosphatase [Neisseriaceae bacterium PsAf]MCV2502811.1 D-glycero-beta-D-manno-heptose 1,7-bisphosphate 7-phosphatase [Neisseriaceae bacterium]